MILTTVAALLAFYAGFAAHALLSARAYDKGYQDGQEWGRLAARPHSPSDAAN